MSEDISKSWIYRPREITIWRGLGYGATDLMGGGWGNIVSGVIFTFLMFQGFDPAISGAITGFGRIVDAIFSLFIGTITDGFYRNKLGQRFGRRHFFIGMGIIFFTFVFPLFWLNVSNDDGTPNFWYYCIVYCAIEVIIAFILIPWETLPTEMTQDYKLRTVLSGSRMFISAAGTSIVFFVIAFLKGINSPDAYLITGIVYTVLFVVAMVVSYCTTWERALTDDFIKELEAQPRLDISQYLKKTITDYFSTFRNKAFRKHLSVYLLSYTGKDFYAVVMPTFIVYACLLQDGDPWTMNALAFFGIFSTLAAGPLMVKKGPRFLFTLSYSTIILSMIAYFVVFYFQIDNMFVILMVVSAFYHLGRGILEFTAWNVFPFIPDVDYIMTREHRAGIYAAVMTFFRKSTGALATTVAGFLLSEVGFEAAPKNDASGAKCAAQCIADYAAGEPWDERLAIALIFFVGTVILIGGALAIARVFRIDRHTHAILKDEFNRLEAGGAKSAVTPEAKRIVETLTGHDYDKAIWPDVPGEFKPYSVRKVAKFAKLAKVARNNR